MAKVVVTGGSGYIGGWCVAALLAAGHEVRATVRSLARESEVRRALATVAPDAAGERLSFAACSLESDAGWDEAAAGCEYMLHVASPLGVPPPKDRDELVGPARDGALRALRAARAAGVKRVVMTSSVAAASPGVPEGPTDETAWTDPDDPKVGPYPRSKTLAERAAWDFIAKEGGPMTLATVNPSLVLGPVMGSDFSPSIQIIQRALKGSFPGVPRLGFNVVDARDVADLHLRCMTDERAGGQRFIAASGFMWMADMAEVMKRRLGEKARKVPTAKLPDFVLRFISIFDRDVRTVTSDLGVRRDFSSAKAQSVLGWKPRPPEEVVVETAQSLIAHGLA